MTTYTITEIDWTEQLAEAIEQSVDGDTIEVPSLATSQLARRAIARLCPDKKVSVELYSPDLRNLPRS